MKSLTIIILNYNGWEDTIECLQSLESTIRSEQYDLSLIVVDNDSQNESVEYLSAYMRDCYRDDFCCTSNSKEALDYKCVLFRSNENLGFSAGNNIGIRIVQERKSDYVMLLNNDTVVDDGFLPPLVQMLEENSSLGMVGPKIYDYYHRQDYTLGGYYSKYRGSGYLYYNTERADKKNVTFLSGCCWLIKTKVFDTCGLMDEVYFLYVEDVDYSCTVRNKGFNLSCTKDSIIYHKEERSTSFKPILYYYNTRNRLYLHDKFENGFIDKFIFYIYFIITRLSYYLRDAKLRYYIKRAVVDYKKQKFGKIEL